MQGSKTLGDAVSESLTTRKKKYKGASIVVRIWNPSAHEAETEETRVWASLGSF